MASRNDNGSLGWRLSCRLDPALNAVAAGLFIGAMAQMYALAYRKLTTM